MDNAIKLSDLNAMPLDVRMSALAQNVNRMARDTAWFDGKMILTPLTALSVAGLRNHISLDA